MNKKYIELEALLGEIDNAPVSMSICMNVDECKGRIYERERLMRIIREIPAADVVPVRHAYWRHYDTTMGGTKLYVCSLCDGDSKTENEIKRCAYCPNCGARMDGDGDD